MRMTARRRPGFTLLEVMLASALAVVLMAALYVALDVQLRLAVAGRDQIEQATLERAVTQRFETDLANVLGPVAPPVSVTAGVSALTPMATQTVTEEGEIITDAASTADTIPFQAGVVGDFGTLTIYVSRSSKTAEGQADIRRITYWMTEKGLARQEIPYVTSEQVANNVDPVIEDDKEAGDYVIAEEVTGVVFEYWDGGAWAESWDGSELGADEKSPKGPPSAVRVRLTVTVPGQADPKEIRHVIAIRSAAGPATDADMATTTP